MSNATKKPAEPTTVKVVDPAKAPTGKLQHIGGSKSDDWNNFLTDQTLSTLWLASKDEARNRQYSATLAALIGVAPQGEIEGMIAAQLVACHNASMECYRRAMIGEQTFEGRRENLCQANKLSRTYATLLESLNRHRGKGTQKVTVARPRPRGRPGHCWQRRGPGGWFSSEIRRSTCSIRTSALPVPARARAVARLSPERPKRSSRQAPACATFKSSPDTLRCQPHSATSRATLRPSGAWSICSGSATSHLLARPRRVGS